MVGFGEERQAGDGRKQWRGVWGPGTVRRIGHDVFVVHLNGRFTARTGKHPVMLPHFQPRAAANA
jgi:hypothetical protein